MKALVIITVVFIIIDCISGVLQAIKNKELNSTQMRNGFFNKCGYFLVIVLALVCDNAMIYLDLLLNPQVFKLACVYIDTTEIISIIENIGKLSPKLIPSKIKDIFFKLNDKR